ncbi:riboflavin synthase [Geomicrobium sediminis]|uniref:Riboflavin synthase n=1 Tax=Geomicrobium sediminis TaxID=1347788 RepID=A0ABS2PCC0_9BACL|nr:riboflavin synthase [Geomicrobium sediminis]MBM7632981.1 riboflavin synthase [Geomicrobium sediminis]
MFTGIVEEVGTVEELETFHDSITVIIRASVVLEDVQIGDSISVSGVCLTVRTHTKTTFTADIMQETLLHSTLNHLKKGNTVNLERSMRMNDRIGGHFVAGHVDGTGTIQQMTELEGSTLYEVAVPEQLTKYMIKKGSVAINGTSLTIADIKENVMTVSIIPHTKDVTQFQTVMVGDPVNLEVDQLGKYVEKLLEGRAI